MPENSLIPASASTLKSRRDPRLDFWRGLCLIDMLLVHLYFSPVNLQFGARLGNFIGNYSRFAAGGFILLSGACVGAIFLPRASQPGRGWRTYRALWKRSLYILGVQYFYAVTLMTFTTTGTQSPWVMLRDVALLRQGGDLLPFYVVMIALSPFMLACVRRKGGALALLAFSVVLFVFGDCNMTLATHWPLDRFHLFPPVLWQLIFICGLVFGSLLPRYDALRARWKIGFAAVCWSAFALLFWSEYSFYFNWPALNLHMDFSKIPLSAGEAVRYLAMTFAIISTTDLLWRWIGPRLGLRWIQTLGRNSLPVYVMHLWLLPAVGYLCAAWWFMGRWQILLAMASVAALWFAAVVIEFYYKVRPARAPVWSGALPTPEAGQ